MLTSLQMKTGPRRHQGDLVLTLSSIHHLEMKIWFDIIMLFFFISIGFLTFLPSMNQELAGDFGCAVSIIENFFIFILTVSNMAAHFMGELLKMVGLTKFFFLNEV